MSDLHNNVIYTDFCSQVRGLKVTVTSVDSHVVCSGLKGNLIDIIIGLPGGYCSSVKPDKDG